MASRLEQKGRTFTEANSPPRRSVFPGIDFEYNDGTPSKRSRRGMSQDVHTTQSSSIADSSSQTLNSTSYNDPIHQHITLDELTVRIIDTPEFQRLHHLKQLGVCDYVYRGATHTRFEHSIGVAYLAERVITNIRKNQPGLDVTTADIRAVKVAGLCHDLGHGPFSHVFDGVFIKRMHPDGVSLDGSGEKGKWRHEDGSVRMFESMLRKNGINVQNYGLEEIDLRFIKEIIRGTPEHKRQGRGADKFWMYDIVNNGRSGLDVDKLDYFTRDMRYANVACGTNDFTRFIELGRVLPAEPIKDPGHAVGRDNADLPTMICYPMKMYEEALALFQVRFKMHRTVYTHKTVKQIEYMITDALQLADEYVQIRGSRSPLHPNGMYKMSETVRCMDAFAELKDTILDHIMLLPCDQSDEDHHNLAQAQSIIQRVRQRDLYRCVGKVTHRRDSALYKMKEEQILKEILAVATPHTAAATSSAEAEHGAASSPSRLPPPPLVVPLSPQAHSNMSQASVTSTASATGGTEAFMHRHPGAFGSQEELLETDLIVEKMHVHHGMKANNPVSRLRFFPKHSGEDAIGRQVQERFYETALPKAFEDFAVRVFCRNQAKEDSARNAFKAWQKQRSGDI